MLFVLHCKILTGKKKKKGFSLKWLLLASQTSLMGVTNPYVLKNVVSFVLLTNPWSFQIAKDLFIDFFSLPEWNASSYFKLNSCRILTGKSPWKKCGLFHHAHVINKINIRAYNLHHHYLTIPLWDSLYIFTNIFDALYLDCIYIPYTIVEIDMITCALCLRSYDNYSTWERLSVEKGKVHLFQGTLPCIKLL